MDGFLNGSPEEVFGKGIGRFLSPSPLDVSPDISPDDLRTEKLLGANTLRGHALRGFVGLLDYTERAVWYARLGRELIRDIWSGPQAR